MTQKFAGIKNGFGTRLRAERTRLGLTQAEMGKKAGIQRLAQIQYEAETRTPTIRYLSKISVAGVDLQYLLFGEVTADSKLSPTVIRDIEQKVFILIEQYVELRCGGQLSAESRFVLFELLRAQLIQRGANSVESVPSIDMAALLASG